MKEYINDLIPYYDIDYCRYSDWGYKKTTRFWTNIEDLEFIPCNNKCDNMVETKHKIDVSKEIGGGSNRLPRYRIPPKLIETMFVKMTHSYQLGHGSNPGIYKKYEIPPKLIETMFKVIQF